MNFLKAFIIINISFTFIAIIFSMEAYVSLLIFLKNFVEFQLNPNGPVYLLY